MSGQTNDGVSADIISGSQGDVLPPTPFYVSDFNKELFLSISPYQQLNNIQVPATNKEVLFPDYFTITNFNTLNENNNLSTIDLQNYYSDNSLSIKASAPATIGFILPEEV